VIIIDTSGSMYGTKLREAQAATAAAIDCLPDGVHFALIAGNHEARVVFPLSPRRPSPRSSPVKKPSGPSRS